MTPWPVAMPPFCIANIDGNRSAVGFVSTRAEVKWQGNGELSGLAGKTVRLQFELTNGALYSFWVSRDATGRSDGYVASGGLAYPDRVDTVGDTE